MGQLVLVALKVYKASQEIRVLKVFKVLKVYKAPQEIRVLKVYKAYRGQTGTREDTGGTGPTGTEGKT